MTFNEPWMGQINQHLLERLWASKGCPGTLHTEHFGVRLAHILTPLGVIIYVRHGLWTDEIS